MLGLYLLMVKAEVAITSIVIAFGFFIIFSMSIINRVYRAKISS
jgi:hypothetical protein